MNTKRAFELALTALFFLLLTSCSLQGSQGNFKCTTQSGNDLKIENELFEYSPDVGGKVSVEYELADLSPNTLYDAVFEFDSSQNSDLVSVNTAPEYDINGEATRSVMSNGVIHHLILTDDDGKSALTVNIGNDESRFFGTVKLKSISVCRALESKGLKVLGDESQAITFAFLSDDYGESAAIQKNAQIYLEACGRLKQALNEFMQCDIGETVFVFTESIDHTGLSGELIYINNSDIEKLFCQELADNPTLDSTISVLCHEMSHRCDFGDSFDEKYKYCFDKEFFTVLRQMYALSSCGYELDRDYLPNNGNLAKGIYDYREFLRKYLEAVGVFDEADNWEYARQYLLQNKETDEALSNAQKCEMLFEQASALCQKDIKSAFSQTELNTIFTHFENK